MVGCCIFPFFSIFFFFSGSRGRTDGRTAVALVCYFIGFFPPFRFLRCVDIRGEGGRWGGSEEYVGGLPSLINQVFFLHLFGDVLGEEGNSVNSRLETNCLMMSYTKRRI
jgi:hypothetical protein